jgi:mannose-6-phosphate isomerase-like protein (cupin superfamily)
MQFQNVQQSALANNQFRKVLFTNKHSQVVLMSISPEFINTGTEDMKLFTVYSPPEHPDGVVHVTKADALAHPEE